MLNIGTLARRLSTAGLTLPEAAFCVGAILECLTESLKKGEEIKLKGFGVFHVKTEKGRAVVGGHKRIVFKASRTLKSAINNKAK